MSEAAISHSCVQLGLELNTESTSNILKIKSFLKFYGRAMNLAGADLDAQIDEALHVVALAKQLQVRGRWLDIGSGGGFPALILAACLDLEFVLVEPRAKRASSLELALAKIGRHDVRVLRGRIEAGEWTAIEGGQLERGFDIASARAVFAPQRWVEEARPWVRDGGLICLHLRAGESAPESATVVRRVDGPRWAAVAMQG